MASKHSGTYAWRLRAKVRGRSRACKHFSSCALASASALATAVCAGGSAAVAIGAGAAVDDDDGGVAMVTPFA